MTFIHLEFDIIRSFVSKIISLQVKDDLRQQIGAAQVRPWKGYLEMNSNLIHDL